jgi:Holliday junction resolvase RusA-like endonuclease
MTIEINGLPRMTNNLRVHWSVKNRESNKWKEFIFHAVNEQGTVRPKYALKKAKITITRFSSKRPDYDGLVSCGKHLLDGLINAGIIVDDSYEVIGNPIYLWELAKIRKGKMRITVEEL